MSLASGSRPVTGPQVAVPPHHVAAGPGPDGARPGPVQGRIPPASAFGLGAPARLALVILPVASIWVAVALGLS